MMLKIATARFGEISIKDDRLIEFPEGLYGFEDKKRYILIEASEKKGPLKWLQSVDDGGLAFVVCDPFFFHPGYRPALSRAQLERLKLKDVESAGILCIAVIPEKVDESTVNLAAPLVVNPVTRKGKQVILENPEYGTREPLFVTPSRAQERQTG